MAGCESLTISTILVFRRSWVPSRTVLPTTPTPDGEVLREANSVHGEIFREAARRSEMPRTWRTAARVGGGDASADAREHVFAASPSRCPLPRPVNLEPRTSNLEPQTANRKPQIANRKSQIANCEPRTTTANRIRPRASPQPLPRACARSRARRAACPHRPRPSRVRGAQRSARSVRRPSASR